MNFRQELAKGIKDKYFWARVTLFENEGINPNTIKNTGCVVIAFDGFMRGGLSRNVYLDYFRNSAQGKGISKEGIVEIALEINQIIYGSRKGKYQPEGNVRFYSSSPNLIGRTNFTPEKMSRGQALEMVEDLRRDKTLGVLIMTEVKRVKGGQVIRGKHLLSLIGDKGAILRVDGATPSLVSCLSSREAANLMRRGQRHGLVIDIR